jgi:thiosulfate/3-mercaptopyruvate sulfurtransferase
MTAVLTRRQFLTGVVEAGLTLGLLGSGVYGLIALSRPYPRDRLVSPRDVQRLIEAGEGVVLLDARPPLRYRRGHLSGAANVWDGDINIWTDVPRRLAPAARLTEVFERAGVTLSRPVVVYDGGEGVWAARLLWVLEYVGHPDVNLLDGGLAAWVAAGGALTQEPPPISTMAFQPRVRPELLAMAEWLLGRLDPGSGDAVQIVDARSLREYAEGHLPGALSLPATSLLRRDGRFRPAHELRLKAQEAGLRLLKDATMVVYSETGLRASLVYVGLRLLGAPSVRVYDGGWAEWQQLGAPIERSLVPPRDEHRSTCW